jgi:hypothetical protein
LSAAALVRDRPAVRSCSIVAPAIFSGFGQLREPNCLQTRA